MAVGEPRPLSVLIVDDDLSLLKALSDELGRRGYQVLSASGFATAQAQLGRGPIDVLLTDLRLGGRDGLELIRHVASTSPSTRTILMSAYATVRDYKAARGLGALDVLAKPFTPEELEAVMRRAEAPEARFQAAVDGLTLADLLQVLHHSRRTATVRVAQEGAVYVRNGEIVHAQIGEKTGEAALESLLDHPGGSLATEALEAGCPQTIDTPFQVLLLRAYTHLDERGAPLSEDATEASQLADEVDLAFDDPQRPSLAPGRVVKLRKAVESTAPLPGMPVGEELRPVVVRVEPPLELDLPEPRPAVVAPPLPGEPVTPRRSRAPLVLLALAILAVVAWMLLRPTAPGGPGAAPASAPLSGAPASGAPASDALGGPASAAPASEAPASEAPASQAPTSVAPVSQAPASAPPSEAPATEPVKRPKRPKRPVRPPTEAAPTDARPNLGTVD